MGRERINPCAPKLKEYLQNLYIDLDNTLYAKKTGLNVDIFNKIINNETLPKYNILKDIVEVAGGNMEEIKRIVWEYPQITYKYWDNFYPEAQSVKKLGYIFTDIINDKKINRKELIERMDIAQSYLSCVENCRIPVTFKILTKFANVVDIEPIDILSQLKKVDDFEINAKKFRSIIIKERRNRGWSIKDASKTLKISEMKLAKIENGTGKVTINQLTEIVNAYELNYDELMSYAFKGKVLNRQYADIKEYYKGAVTGKTKKQNERNLEQYLLNLCKYNYIQMGEFNPKVKIESHTLVTLLFLLLSNENETKEKYKSQIIYYLNNLRECGDIYKSFISSTESNIGEIGIGNFYENCRKKMSFTYTMLELYSGFSRNFINNRISKNDFKSVNACNRLFPILGIPVSIGYESLCLPYRKILNTDSTITIDEIIKEMQSTLIWTHKKQTVPIEAIKGFFKIVGERGDCYSKYDLLKKLPFPNFS